ncbi:MAG TPA: lytic transglycosylase F [Porphyromonadaceae bacterium]|jgi:membrane-bound lytic murein transglycosylase F|uniref:transglycosylase SLT domain-containing protein n=1 Tax=Limibacterium fermenti TaxID=3229863 RepID=UPI000E930FAC|nr:lytic transglycosylase F [Porphyromonadaceae bacterium]HBX20944.1 lytic transglycosylase F [Porphyromonadaceae bacterium]HBX44585.1 lytic transglycosylase F [Porphyromonadaceae bacterium]HCM21773.1 lytic transglycosylase F [Porphyromonadaceae bacterium]
MGHLIRVFAAILLLLASCTNAKKEASSGYDFSEIMEKDTLRILTLNTSTSYFIYRDQPMGYHYDMVKDFCRQHNLVPEIIIAQNAAAMVDLLQAEKADMIAYPIPLQNRLKDSLIYCGLQQITHQVLVQRAEATDTLLSDVTQLIGKQVTVLNGSQYEQRMQNLNEELGGGIDIRTADKDTIILEDLIRMVSEGEIRYTVANNYLAKLNQTYYRNIDINLQVSFDQRSSWVVTKNRPVLADSLNRWFEQRNTQPTYSQITKRYFEETKRSAFYSPPTTMINLQTGQISPFDTYFKHYGDLFGIDWRLLTSMAYYESSFDPLAEAWTGAGGLMGLMPSTAETVGVSISHLFDPEQNIRGGTRYLKRLLDTFSSVKDPSERLKLALAAYNGGIGHVSDARALAQKYQADKNVWSGNVERYLQLKRLQLYYEDPVCQFGYFRSDETVNYVKNVMAQWQSYKEKTDDSAPRIKK